MALRSITRDMLIDPQQIDIDLQRGVGELAHILNFRGDLLGHQV